MASTSFLVLLTIAAAGQSRDAVPAAPGESFAVASVKPSAPPTGGPMFFDYGPRPGGQWVSQNAALMVIVRAAYPAYSLPGQIVGPDWINTERFDINARADGDPSGEVMSAMLRRLLADRFDLQVHTEQRELDVFALMLAREDGRPGARAGKRWHQGNRLHLDRRQRSRPTGPNAGCSRG